MGEWVVLRKGDLIETEQLNGFIYDQGEETCNIENQGRCDDEFSYIPYGRWTGHGEYQTTQINITPVLRDSSAAMQQSSIAAGASIEFKKEKLALNQEVAANQTCAVNTPVMIVLSIVAISLMVPIGVLASKIKGLKEEGNTNEL